MAPNPATADDGVPEKLGAVAEVKMEEGKKIGEEEEYDPWALPELTIETTAWEDRTAAGKARYVLWDCFLKPLTLIGLIYLFICSLDFLSSAFRLLGGRTAGEVFANSEVLSNPVAGLMIGVLVTVLVQSSSTSTSIVIAMVGANVLTPKHAIYIVMGANIGTTVTNTIVAMGQMAYKEEFRRAFGAATVHDMFNWLTVIVVLPLEAMTGGLFRFTEWLINVANLNGLDSNVDLLKVITKPFTKLIVKINKQVITDLSLGIPVADDATLLKRWCEHPENVTNVVSFNATHNQTTNTMEGDWVRCENLFAMTDLSDAQAGGILLLGALVILCFCLFLIVKILHSMLRGRIAGIIKKVINMDLPKVPWLTGYIAIVVGAGCTVIVQSSSIFTSTLTPLVGVGLISIQRMYPLTLGSNIGTTATGMMAALVAEPEDLPRTMQVALMHLFFNISGILLYYPIPAMRKLPINAAKYLGNTTAEFRWFAFFYLIVMFFALPGLIFALSLAGWYVLVAVGVPVLILVIFVTVVNVLQKYRQEWLVPRLRTWDFLPLCMHSWKPLDGLFKKIFGCCCCCCNDCCKSKDNSTVELHVTSNGHIDTGHDNPAISDTV